MVQCYKNISQKYTIITYDQRTVMKAMPVIWDKPEAYSNHIVLINSFHTNMNYMHMITEKMAGSGIADLLIEANLVTIAYT